MATKETSELSGEQPASVGQQTVEQQTVGEYLSLQNIKSDDFATTEGRKSARLRHQLDSRTKVLTALIIPMYVAPIWLMVMISLPAFNIKSFSERMQFALLSALASDLIGLCYVVTRDLFPQKPDGWDEEDEPDE